MAVRIKAYAKVNLTLEVVGQKDGYHLLDSLVTEVDLYDLIILKKRKDGLSFVKMHGMGSEEIPPEKNNAWKAADAFVKEFGTTGAEIVVYKNIPMGAGLGGSSADVAGVLNGMAKLYGLTEERERLKSLADSLGSDTGYMLTGGFARMQGRGEIVTPLPIKERLYFLLICPSEGVSTAECFRVFDQQKEERGQPFSMGERTEKCIRALMNGEVNEGGRYLTNDLFEAAKDLSGAVKDAHKAACGFAPLGAVMTGSGSGVLAMFENEEFCRWAKSRYRGKAKTYIVKTLPPKRSGWRNPFVLSEEERALGIQEE